MSASHSSVSARLRDTLSRDELRGLLERSDWKGVASVAVSWAIIVAALALVAWWPNPATVLVALVLLGGRQLGLAILMHEASHRSLCKTRRLNDLVGAWLCAAPIWQRMDAYRRHHLAHHAHTNTERDTDRSLVAPFPITTRSLARKVARDLLGVSGLKRVYGLLLMDLGYIEYTASVDVKALDQRGRTWGDRLRDGARHLAPVLLTNGLMLGVLLALGHGWLYLLWVGAYLTTFSLFIRVRSMAEHACTDPSTDPLRNTRTTYASPLARLTVAPHHVNYHLEHHLLMTVPHYNLPRLHTLLLERGLLDEAPISRGYWEVLKTVTREPEAGGSAKA